MYDAIIIGAGLAAQCMAHTLHQHQKKFIMYHNTKGSQCSVVATGVVNPINFYRVTKAWEADAFLQYNKSFYKSINAFLPKACYDYNIPYIKLLQQEDYKKWVAKQNEAEGSYFTLRQTHYINDKLLPSFGYADIHQVSRLHCNSFISQSIDIWQSIEQYIPETFDYTALQTKGTTIKYKSIEAQCVIFCEGYEVDKNIFINNKILKPVKGEKIIMAAKNSEPLIVHRTCSVVYDTTSIDIGATYDWDNIDEIPSVEAKKNLLIQYAEISSQETKVINHVAGVRPAAIDRKPILGVHPNFKQLYIFNGLGTKGVLMAPKLSYDLYKNIFEGKPIDTSLEFKRFYNY